MRLTAGAVAGATGVDPIGVAVLEGTLEFDSDLGALAYVEAARGRLGVADGARGISRPPVRIGGAVLIAVAANASSPGTLTRFDLTGARPTSEVAGTADNAPGTARLTCRMGGPLAPAATLTP